MGLTFLASLHPFLAATIAVLLVVVILILIRVVLRALATLRRSARRSPVGRAESADRRLGRRPAKGHAAQAQLHDVIARRPLQRQVA